MPREIRILTEWTQVRKYSETPMKLRESHDIEEMQDPFLRLARIARDLSRAVRSRAPGSLRVSVAVDLPDGGKLDVLLAESVPGADVLLTDLPIPERPYDEEDAAAAERRRRRQAPSAPGAPRRREDRDAG